ncbi:MAG: transcription termination/antitermination factor NusG [Phycisphaerales bacterium]|nr:transcription termination/antitermination factor NusG [Phycisphaerales bacterium]
MVETSSEKQAVVLCAPGMHWYVLRVASNKEDRVRDTLERKMKIEGLTDRVGRILVPTVKERKVRGGQVKVSERKLYPGYVFVEMATEEDGSIPEDVWFAIKEASGVGDFISSAGKPTSMPDHDAAAMLAACQKGDEEPTLADLKLQVGDAVKITDGSFENFEGEVVSIDKRRGMVTVGLEVFGRATPVEVEYWQLEKT